MAGTVSAHGVRHAWPVAVRASAPEGSDSSRSETGSDEDMEPVGSQSVGIHEAHPPSMKADTTKRSARFMTMTRLNPAANPQSPAAEHTWGAFAVQPVAQRFCRRWDQISLIDR